MLLTWQGSGDSFRHYEDYCMQFYISRFEIVYINTDGVTTTHVNKQQYKHGEIPDINFSGRKRTAK